MCPVTGHNSTKHGQVARIPRLKIFSSPLALINQGDSLRLRIENHHQRGAGMLPQGVLGFQYEADRSSGGLTSLAGLPLYLDLIEAIGLGAAIRQQVHLAGAQGWLDIQMVLALIFLNLAGGDCVEDLERLETDSGFAAVLRAIEHDVLSPAWRAVAEDAMATPARAHCAITVGRIGVAGAVP
jgi:hypothetical protein